MHSKRRRNSFNGSDKTKKSGNTIKKAEKSIKKTCPEHIGTIRLTRDGYAFIVVEGEEDDIFVKASKTHRALNGDKVKVAVTKSAGTGRRREGEIREVLERSRKPLIGVLHIVGNQAWALMQSKFMPYDISLEIDNGLGNPGMLKPLGKGEYAVHGLYETIGNGQREMTAHSGMKVAVVVDGWKRNATYPEGHIIDVLGEMGENDTEMHAILAEYGLPYRFEPEVANAADAISEKITIKDIKARKDFRDTLTFTIDPADAKDFDDALSFRELENGNYEVGVHIADVSHYVTPGSVVDKEAQARGTSVYLVDRTVPMLPEKLSNKLCSLRPSEEKLTFSAVFEITPKAKICDCWFGRTVIRSDYRFAYESAQQIIDAGDEALKLELKGGTDGKSGNSDEYEVTDGCIIPIGIKKAILQLWGIASQLRNKRFSDGAVSFERPEMKVLVDGNGKPVDVLQKTSKEANWLIEEFMLLANRKVAEFIATEGKMDGKTRKNAKTFIYRIHDEPNSQKLFSLGHFAGNFGYKTDFSEPAQVSKALNGLFAQAKGKPEFMALEMLALRSMSKACYSTDNIGHYGLAFKHYTHFTSPIRRYPDTMVHRLLAMYLNGSSSQSKNYYEEQCSYASEREVVAVNAERDSIKYKLVEFMQDKLGIEFDGHISGLTEWGMFVEIEPSKIEGAVSLRDIRTDFFEFDEENYRLVGKRTGLVYRLGDPVRIKVKNANIEQRLLDYELVESHTAEPKSQHSNANLGNKDARKAKIKAAIQASKKKKQKSKGR